MKKAFKPAVGLAYDFSNSMSVYSRQCLEAVDDYVRGILKSETELENALRVISERLVKELDDYVQQYQNNKGD